MLYEEITDMAADASSPKKYQNRPDHKSEQAMKENWDHVDDKVA